MIGKQSYSDFFFLKDQFLGLNLLRITLVKCTSHCTKARCVNMRERERERVNRLLILILNLLDSMLCLYLCLLQWY